jgi:hypothetical protein
VQGQALLSWTMMAPNFSRCRAQKRDEKNFTSAVDAAAFDGVGDAAAAIFDCVGSVQG